MEPWTIIEGGTLGIADGDETPEPLSGVLVITPRFASLSTETGFIVTGPIYVPVKDGVIPEIHVPAVEGGTALVEFRLKGQLCGPVEFPDTEIPVEPGTTIQLSDYIPRGVDPGTGGILVPGPPGPPGASVVGARDNGDQTVTFIMSDGSETDPVAIPPGPQGPEGPEGREGPEGPQGVEGPAGPPPSVEWVGPRLDVGGQLGPDLTGPEGPQGPQGPEGPQGVEGPEGPEGAQGVMGPDGPPPSVEWDGPHLTVGGVTGPDLTGPRGAPGTVPTAADYMVVGPGRPDAPTTTGMSSAALAALPVGAEYRSTDGASVGAWVWRKRPTGWVVTDGDTGWRSGLGEPGANPLIRREGSTVLVSPNGPGSAPSGGGAVALIATIPAGFWGPSRAGAAVFRGTARAGVMDARPHQNPRDVRVQLDSGVLATELSYRLTWSTDDPWPTTLPGTAA